MYKKDRLIGCSNCVIKNEIVDPVPLLIHTTSEDPVSNVICGTPDTVTFSSKVAVIGIILPLCKLLML